MSSPSAKYHTFAPRFLAGIVDTLLFTPIAFADEFLSAPERGVLIVLAWALISNSALWIYSVLMHARFGQTLGKMALGIKVLDVSEARLPTLRQAFLRDLGYIVLSVGTLAYLWFLMLSGRYVPDGEMSGLPARILEFAGLGWVLLEVLSMLTNRKRRALHDYIAGTVVVRNPSTQERSARAGAEP